MVEEPKPAVNPQAVPAGQPPGTPPADPPKPGESTPSPGENTDKSQLLAALQQERDRRRAAESERDVLKGQVGQPSPTPPVQDPTPQPTDNVQAQVQQKIQAAWDEGDPQKAVNMQVAMALDWYDRINTGLTFQKSQARGKFSDFDKYETQAMDYIRNIPLNQRSMPGVVEMAYLIEKGKVSDQVTKTVKDAAIDDVIKRLQAGENVQGITGGTGQPATGPGVQASDMQAKAAAAMGVSIEDYLKNIKAGPK